MSDQTITAAMLAEWRATTEAATPGPWEADYGGTVGHVKSVATPDESTPTVARFDIWFGHGEERDKVARSIGKTPEQEQANGRFIATAREAMPLLIAEVERLRAELAACPAWHDAPTGPGDWYVKNHSEVWSLGARELADHESYLNWRYGPVYGPIPKEQTSILPQ